MDIRTNLTIYYNRQIYDTYGDVEFSLIKLYSSDQIHVCKQAELKPLHKIQLFVRRFVRFAWLFLDTS